MILHVFILNWFLRRQYQFVPKENMQFFSMTVERETYSHGFVGRTVSVSRSHWNDQEATQTWV